MYPEIFVIKFGIVPIRDDDHCMIYRTHYNHDDNYNICVGGRGIIARDGDSGGPLTCILKDEEGNLRQVLYGASSFSAQKVTATYPSVYTKISYFIDWIEDTIEQNEISNNSNDNENSSVGIQIAPRSFVPSGPAGLQPISSKKQDSIKLAPKGATPIMPDDDLFKPNIDCYYRNQTGISYRGQHNFAEKGVACVPWNMLNPRNKFHPNQSKMKYKDLRENFCRNPDNDSKGPWCFVSVRQRGKPRSKPRYQYCEIPHCESLLKQKISETLVTETMLMQPTTEVTTGSSDVAIMRAFEPDTTESSSDTGTWLAPTNNWSTSTTTTTTTTTTTSTTSTTTTTTTTTMTISSTTTTTTTTRRRFRRRCRRFYRWRNGKCVSIRRRTSTPQYTTKHRTSTTTTTRRTTRSTFPPTTFTSDYITPTRTSTTTTSTTTTTTTSTTTTSTTTTSITTTTTTTTSTTTTSTTTTSTTTTSTTITSTTTTSTTTTTTTTKSTPTTSTTTTLTTTTTTTRRRSTPVRSPQPSGRRRQSFRRPSNQFRRRQSNRHSNRRPNTLVNNGYINRLDGLKDLMAKDPGFQRAKVRDGKTCLDGNGVDYRGGVATTVDGVSCRPWNELKQRN